jgi:arsenate reductase (thioredoxin)
MKRLLILCTGNSARSQMAEGLFRHEGGDGVAVFSAGTRPGSVRPEAIAAMAEIGIDISGHRSKSVDEFLADPPDLLITVCDSARETCPVFPVAVERLHWPFEDPAGVEGPEEARLAAFRRVRDRIHARIRTFLAEL